MTYLHDAFHAVIDDAKAPEQWYVCLVELYQYYGGPEEGGWWGTDSCVVAYREFPTEKLAENAAEAVRKFAYELESQSYKEHGEQCLREMDWLDARGLDADYLPEPDGPSKYTVAVTQEIPETVRGSRHYC